MKLRHFKEAKWTDAPHGLIPGELILSTLETSGYGCDRLEMDPLKSLELFMIFLENRPNQRNSSPPCRHACCIQTLSSLLTSPQRQRLLDSACAPLRVKLFRMGATPMELGEASLQLSALIHDTASLDPGTCVGRGYLGRGRSQTGGPKLQWFCVVLSHCYRFRGVAW